MKNKLSPAFDKILPSAEELWQRGGAEIVSTEIEPGHIEVVPFFDLEIIDQKQLSVSDLQTRDGRRSRKIGKQIVSQFVLSDGIDRLSRAIIVDDKYRSQSDFIVTDGTAWTTTIDGYAHHRAERIASDVGVDTIQVGSEHSGSKIPFGLDGLRLGMTILQARSTSLAKAAQAEQLIIGQLASDYDLPASQYVIGDSRASMRAPGQFPYARLYDNQIIHLDTKAPCVPERLGPSDVARVARWLGVEAVGGSAVIAQLVSEGKLATLLGTVSANPNFIASSIVGSAPALASGEAGRMVSWTPRDTHGQVVVYGMDGLSLGDKWQQLWAQHSNIYVKSLPRKIHSHLLESKAHDMQVGRISRFSQEILRTDGNLQSVDWSAVYNSSNGRLAPTENAA